MSTWPVILFWRIVSLTDIATILMYTSPRSWWGPSNCFNTITNHWKSLVSLDKNWELVALDRDFCLCRFFCCPFGHVILNIYSSLLTIMVSKQRLCIFHYTNPDCEETIVGTVRVLLLAAFLTIAFGVSAVLATLCLLVSALGVRF